MKTPDSRQASSGVVGEQLCLIDPPPFSPIYPTPSSLAGRALALFLKGRALTTPDFQEVTKSWRLAAYVGKLIHEYGWPVDSLDIPFSDDPNRTISRYFMPAWVLREVGAANA